MAPAPVAVVSDNGPCFSRGGVQDRVRRTAPAAAIRPHPGAITADQRRRQKRALRGSAVQRSLPSARAASSVAASMLVKVPVSILSINGPANRPSGPPLGT
jgi:hypothetical protein